MTGGLGRRVAAGVLAVFLLFQVGIPPDFNVARLALFDFFQSTMPRQPTADHVVVIGIDDDAIKTEGRWPWPRDRQAALIRSLLAAHPKAVGFDGFWPGAAKEDAALVAVLTGAPFVVGVQGFDPGRPIEYEGVLPTVPIAGGDRLADRLPSFPSAEGSNPPVDAAAAGHGVISNQADRDGVFRRYSLLSVFDGRIAPALSLELYRVAERAEFITLLGRDNRAAAVQVGSIRIPTDREGRIWIDYEPRNLVKVCSAIAIVPGKGCRLINSNTIVSLNDKFVLIGVLAPALEGQQRKTPMGGREGAMPGVEIHAQALENIISGEFARTVPHAEIVEPALTLVLGLCLIIALPEASVFGCAILIAATVAILGLGGALLWREFRILADVASPAIGCSAVVVGMLAGGLAEADAQRRRLRQELEIRNLAAAHAEGELEAARAIQMGILPRPEDLARDDRYDLAALMVPARQIGGDLYDFFKIDPDHLFFAVGDVSGKGLPASLFMALGKSLCKSCALRGETDIGAIVRRANQEISRDNPEMLFITLFAGILNLETGELRFCNAGHDAPFLLRAGEAPLSVLGEGGPPLCVADEFPYQTEVRRLMPGDLLCLTTDGVTEAMTADGALMGRNVVERVLAPTTATASARQVTELLQAAVATFVAGAEPSDDLTILMLRWQGPTLP